MRTATRGEVEEAAVEEEEVIPIWRFEGGREGGREGGWIR